MIDRGFFIPQDGGGGSYFQKSGLLSRPVFLTIEMLKASVDILVWGGGGGHMTPLATGLVMGMGSLLNL